MAVQGMLSSAACLSVKWESSANQLQETTGLWPARSGRVLIQLDRAKVPWNFGVAELVMHVDGSAVLFKNGLCVRCQLDGG